MAARKKRSPPGLLTHPLTAARWADFETLFGPRGACGGCWCMTPRLSRKAYAANKGEKNRKAMRALVERGPPPGVLGYADGQPVAWCAVAPRQELVLLSTSRVLAPVDNQPVWSISCLFIHKAHRGQGLSSRMVTAAVDLARRHGAHVVEAYPTDAGDRTLVPVFAYTGLVGTYAAAGFDEVARRSPTRPMMRLTLP